MTSANPCGATVCLCPDLDACRAEAQARAPRPPLTCDPTLVEAMLRPEPLAPLGYRPCPQPPAGYPLRCDTAPVVGTPGVFHVLTPDQVGALRHALGHSRYLHKGEWGYRNAYIARGDSPDARTWACLVALGYAVAGSTGREPSFTGGDTCYHVTRKGVAVLAAYGHEVTERMRKAAAQ